MHSGRASAYGTHSIPYPLPFIPKHHVFRTTSSPTSTPILSLEEGVLRTAVGRAFCQQPLCGVICLTGPAASGPLCWGI